MRWDYAFDIRSLVEVVFFLTVALCAVERKNIDRRVVEQTSSRLDQQGSCSPDETERQVAERSSFSFSLPLSGRHHKLRVLQWLMLTTFFTKRGNGP